MAKLLVDIRDQLFVLNEQFDAAGELSGTEKFKDYDQEILNSMLNAANDLAEKEIFPTLVSGDREGVHFRDGEVSIPKSFHKIYQIFRENGWINAVESPEAGGMGLPQSYAIACNEVFMAANSSFTLYHVLTHGAGKIIESFGTELQKEKYLGKMYSGEWSGTMCLTEPNAGSDLANLRTKAIPLDLKRGLYKIEGEKIFITGGDHDLTFNIVHMVLARIEGDEEGYKGISLFIVPKYRVQDDGALGERNGVITTGIEHKMGLHGSSTASLHFSGETEAIGELVGRPGQGLSPIMFSMMNEERLQIAVQALGIASCGFLHAVKFAKERPQGPHPDPAKREPDVKQVSILNHPDVRAMIFRMKAYVEGMRAMAYWTGLCLDRSQTRIDGKKWQSLVDLLTPIAKAYISDKGFLVNTLALQVHGGYGYTEEYPVEQLVRDSKITAIYEGTNGIQAIDLLLRKLARNDGELLDLLLVEINNTIEQEWSRKEFKEFADILFDLAEKTKKLVSEMLRSMKGGEMRFALGQASNILKIMGDLILGWMWLWQMGVSFQKIQENGDQTEKFYYGKIVTGKYFIKTVLCATLGRIEGILKFKGEIFFIDEKAIVSHFEHL
jgi:hypothetical protein